MIASICFDQIRLDGGTQCRATLDSEHIATIAEAWSVGAEIPPIVVFHDGTNYWLADGFHRYHAAQKNGAVEIACDVRSGTRADAVRYALGANATHGLRRTNADKRRAVEIALREFPKLSSAEIGRVCAVSDMTVKRVRDEQPQQSGGSCERIGADGKSRRVPAPKPEDLPPPVNVVALTPRREPVYEPEPVPEPSGKAAPMSEVQSLGASSWALEYATMAIHDLKKIWPEDPKRAEAFAEVREWLDQNERPRVTRGTGEGGSR